MCAPGHLGFLYGLSLSGPKTHDLLSIAVTSQFRDRQQDLTPFLPSTPYPHRTNLLPSVGTHTADCTTSLRMR